MKFLFSTSTAEHVGDVFDDQQQRLTQILQAVARKDQQAFETLYSMTSAHLFGFLLQILGHRDWAEEALKQYFLAVWEGDDRYLPGQHTPQRWLLDIARRCASHQLREHRIEARRLIANYQLFRPMPDSSIDHSDGYEEAESGSSQHQ